MNIDTKKNIFENVLSFHKHVASKNDVAIDFYAKTPYVNTMGACAFALFATETAQRKIGRFRQNCLQS